MKLRIEVLIGMEKPGGNWDADMVAWVTCGGIVDQVKSILRYIRH